MLLVCSTGLMWRSIIISSSTFEPLWQALITTNHNWKVQDKRYYNFSPIPSIPELKNSIETQVNELKTQIESKCVMQWYVNYCYFIL